MPRWLAANNERFRRAAKAAIFILPALLIGLTLPGALHAQGPALTTISDTVYRADGTAASGTVLISWPSFQTAEGDAVAAGNLAVTIGPLGAFTAQLVPNVGATPGGNLLRGSAVLRCGVGSRLQRQPGGAFHEYELYAYAIRAGTRLFLEEL